MKYLYLFILFFFKIAYSQSTAKINYIVMPTSGSLENRNQKEHSEFSHAFNGVDDALKKIEFELLINNEKSFYHQISSLDLNSKTSRMAKILAGDSQYFRDSKKEKIIRSAEYMGKKFNISLEYYKDWTLIDEIKIINGYKCYKAIVERRANDNAEKKINITAWYCPEIPIAFGPKDYGGLPGLILELQENMMSYFVSRIQIDKNLKIQIEQISDNIISEEVYKKTIKQMTENMINERN